MSTKQSVLIFTDWYEPGFKAGGPIRSCSNIVAALSALFNFYIVTSDRDLGDKQPYPGIARNRWIRNAAGHHLYYASPGSLSLSTIGKIIRQVKPSTIYLNSLFSPRFTLRPLWVLNKMNFKGRIVLAPRGMLKNSALAHKPWKKKIFLWLSTFVSIRKRVVFHATDQQEQTDILQKVGYDCRILVAGNIPAAGFVNTSRRKEPGKLHIIYMSRIHPVKNLHFAFDILKLVENASGIEFDIYGVADDQEYYAKCFEAARKLEGKVNVQFMGEIKHEDVIHALHNSHLFFVPTTGENFGHAIFEALASGCPVLITDQTPWKDVEEAGAGWAIPLADKGKFVQHISEMHRMGQNEFTNLSTQAAAYAASHYSSGNYRERYLELFASGVKLT